MYNLEVMSDFDWAASWKIARVVKLNRRQDFIQVSNAVVADALSGSSHLNYTTPSITLYRTHIHVVITHNIIDVTSQMCLSLPLHVIKKTLLMNCSTLLADNVSHKIATLLSADNYPFNTRCWQFGLFAFLAKSWTSLWQRVDHHVCTVNCQFVSSPSQSGNHHQNNTSIACLAAFSAETFLIRLTLWKTQCCWLGDNGWKMVR